MYIQCLIHELRKPNPALGDLGFWGWGRETGNRNVELIIVPYGRTQQLRACQQATRTLGACLHDPLIQDQLVWALDLSLQFALKQVIPYQSDIIYEISHPTPYTVCRNYLYILTQIQAGSRPFNSQPGCLQEIESHALLQNQTPPFFFSQIPISKVSTSGPPRLWLTTIIIAATSPGSPNPLTTHLERAVPSEARVLHLRAGWFKPFAA